MEKKLRLNRETLRHLDARETKKVAGGDSHACEPTDIGCINTITLWPTACECETINTGATSQCTGSRCTEDNTLCLCPVC